MVIVQKDPVNRAMLRGPGHRGHSLRGPQQPLTGSLHTDTTTLDLVLGALTNEVSARLMTCHTLYLPSTMMWATLQTPGSGCV